jgi:hypothetical protein
MKSRIVDIDLNELIQSVNHDLSLNSMKASVFLLKSVRTIKGLWNTLGLLTEDLRNTLGLLTEDLRNTLRLVVYGLRSSSVTAPKKKNK